MGLALLCLPLEKTAVSPAAHLTGRAGLAAGGPDTPSL